MHNDSLVHRLLRGFTWLPAVVVAYIAMPTQNAASSRFGLVAGREWEYAGVGKWTGEGQRLDSGSIRWLMRCLVVRSASGVRVALLRGWVHDLAWYDPGSTPGYSVLLEYRQRLFVIDAPDSAAAVDTFAQALRSGTNGLHDRTPVIDSGLVVGRVYGGAPDRGDRQDGFYAWNVESAIPLARQTSWRTLANGANGWRLAYRTVPDHELLDFVPGVGITRYVYSHHGTVAETNVRLLAVRQTNR